MNAVRRMAEESTARAAGASTGRHNLFGEGDSRRSGEVRCETTGDTRVQQAISAANRSASTSAGEVSQRKAYRSPVLRASAACSNRSTSAG